MDEKSFKRFAAKLQVDNETGCLLWSATTTADGYGQFGLGGRMVSAHRAAYEHWVGPIPEGLQVDHLCRRRNCCAPDHLDPVTAEENARRRVHHNSLKTHCRHGHEFSARNTRVYRGMRMCRTCQRAWRRTHQRKRYAQD